MTPQPSFVRHALYKRLRSTRFGVPHAAASTIAIVYEPRSNDSEYPDGFVKKINQTQSEIESCLTEQVTSSDPTSIGSIEKKCLNLLESLLDSAREKELTDIVTRLNDARATSRGQTSAPTDNSQDSPRARSLPDPIITKKDRPPFGRWR